MIFWNNAATRQNGKLPEESPCVASDITCFTIKTKPWIYNFIVFLLTQNIVCLFIAAI